MSNLPDPAMFRCRRCGACCRAPGYVALEADELEAVAVFLGIGVYAFTEQYTRLMPDRHGLSLTEDAAGRCVFLTDDNGCRIQSVKPRQCRGFPFLWRTPGLARVCPALAEPT